MCRGRSGPRQLSPRDIRGCSGRTGVFTRIPAVITHTAINAAFDEGTAALLSAAVGWLVRHREARVSLAKTANSEPRRRSSARSIFSVRLCQRRCRLGQLMLA
jgi:hypothetical protein